MTDFFFSIDKALFYFLNHTIQNGVLDVFMPFITRSEALYFRIFYVLVWLGLVIKGGRTGRIVAILLIPLITISDQLSSTFIKFSVNRLRPCWTLPDVHLLVPCGTGFSFPSSHAVNNFAAAGLFSFYYPKWKWAFIVYASLVALSRPYVGVHYPSDIIAGALIGVGVSVGVLYLWLRLEKVWNRRLERRQSSGSP